MTSVALSDKGARRLPGVSLLLCALALLAWCSPEISRNLEWRRDEPWQLWRWFTGHLCHWSGEHLAWDLFVFAVLSPVVERHSRRAFMTCTVSSAVAIIFVVAVWCPELTSYRGLSGIDCGLLGCWLCTWFGKARHGKNVPQCVAVAVIASGFAAKLTAEIGSGTTVFVDTHSAFVPVPLAHVIGFAVGAAIAAVQQMRSRSFSPA